MVPPGLNVFWRYLQTYVPSGGMSRNHQNLNRDGKQIPVYEEAPLDAFKLILFVQSLSDGYGQIRFGERLVEQVCTVAKQAAMNNNVSCIS